MSGFTAQPDELRLATEQIQLELQEVGATVRSTATLEVFEDPGQFLVGMGRALVHRLKAYVLTQHLVGDTFETTVMRQVPVEVPYEVPASWWQHFKLQHLPTVSRWRPVRYRKETASATAVALVPVKVKFDRYAAYPDANIAIRDDRLGKPVLWERFTPEVQQ